jgi:hypothetical protein
MSANLLDQILGQLSPQAVSKIGQKAGTSPAQTSDAISAAIPMLVAALSNNAAKPGGAEALSRAIDKDGHGSEDWESMLERQIVGGVAPANSRMVDHMLGQRRGQVEQALAAKTGTSQDSIAQILQTLGPLVLGAIGKEKQGQGLNPSDLAGYLGQQKSAAKAKSGDMGSMLFDLLDANDDGSIVDDVMRLAGQFIGPSNAATPKKK